MYDVVVIGGGIVGASAAFALSKYNLKAAVLEKENDVACGTTKANSAIIHAGYDCEPGTLMAKLNVRGSELAREICQKLDVPYQRIGSLVIGFTQADEDKIHELYQRGKANGVPDLEILDGNAVKAMEPQLSDEVRCALYAPTAAIVSPWEYALAMMETAVKNGVELSLDTEVVDLRKEADGWHIMTNKGEFTSRYVLNASGLHGHKIHDMAAPHRFDIHPVRGEYYILDKSEGTRASHVIFQCPTKDGKGVLVTPTVHGNLLVGPNSVPSDTESVATTRDGLDFVKEKALKSIPDINFRESIRVFAGLRATGNTGDFIVQEAEGAPGFYDMAGICSPGLSAAPAIGEYVVELMRQNGLSLTEKENYVCERKVTRFRTLSPEEKEALIRERPEYGTVICRCETVTEAEILDSLKGVIPPKSIDGVKRRVNTGMGRCQGGFCSTKIAELLCRELKMDPTELLQDKQGSWILSGKAKEEG